MLPETSRFIVLLALTVIAPTNGWAQTPADSCTPAPVADTPGVVWQGRERLGLRDIAALLAPVLWFSTDEPLLADGRPPIPTAHPCDTVADHPVVYYQVTKLTYRGNTPVGRPEEDDAAFVDKVESFILNYYFYYLEDSGVGGHPHDSRIRRVRGLARR